MPYEPEERMNIFIKFMGYGDLNEAKILFIGLEPIGDLTEWGVIELDRRLEIRNRNQIDIEGQEVCWIPKPLFANEDPTWGTRQRRFNPTDTKEVTLSVRIRREIFGHHITVSDPTNFNNRRNYWLDANGFLSNYEFQSDLFPVPLPNHGKWPEAYTELLGIEQEEYQNRCVDERFPFIRNRIDSVIAGEGYIFFLGKSEWEKARQYLFPALRFNNIAGGRMQCTDDKRRWLIPHPAARGEDRLSNVDIDNIILEIAA